MLHSRGSLPILLKAVVYSLLLEDFSSVEGMRFAIGGKSCRVHWRCACGNQALIAEISNYCQPRQGAAPQQWNCVKRKESASCALAK